MKDASKPALVLFGFSQALRCLHVGFQVGRQKEGERPSKIFRMDESKIYYCHPLDQNGDAVDLANRSWNEVSQWPSSDIQAFDWCVILVDNQTPLTGVNLRGTDGEDSTS